MDELNKIIDKYTEGNYLIGKTVKEEMAKDILALFSVSQQRELLFDFSRWMYENVNFDGIRDEEIDSYLTELKSNKLWLTLNVNFARNKP